MADSGDEVWRQINDERDRRSKMGAYAPLIRITITRDGDPWHKGNATEKQKAYLRQLGVRNQEDLLSRLDKDDASAMIDRVLRYREQQGLPTEYL